MARPDIKDLPDEHLARVQQEIADFLFARTRPMLEAAGIEGTEPTTSSLTIGETLPIWRLTTKAFEVLKESLPTGDLAEWAEPTLFYYHQLRFKEELIASARSAINESQPRVVTQISDSTFSGLVDDAIEFIERNQSTDRVTESDPVVRLLEIPSYQTFALWLFETESRVVVVRAPEGLTKYRFYTSQDLFEALKRTGPISGIV